MIATATRVVYAPQALPSAWMIHARRDKRIAGKFDQEAHNGSWK
jgi:hypothetical protein